MQHVSLSELNHLIKETLNTTLEPSYWIVAEIGELRENRNGHCYLEFVEKDESSDRLLAKIRGTIWSYTYRNLSAWFQSITGQPLKAGMTVLANVQISFHEVYGLSLNVKDIDPNFTLGERARKKQEILNQLEEDGVLEMNKTLPLPLVPQHIAIISAESAAGYGDFMNQLQSNSYNYQFHCTLYPALMQGEKASSSIIDALHHINESIEDYDAVILIRGGGAQVDLDCFDNYELAAHIAQFPLPIFTGIGHERDETICDLVAHTKLKTPTAVAEFLIRGINDYEEKIKLFGNNIIAISNQKIERAERNLNDLKHQFRYALKRHFNSAERKINKLEQQLVFQSRNQISKGKNKLALYEKSLELSNPKNILKKGYSHTSVNGKNIVAAEVKAGDEIKTVSLKQEIKSTVKTVKKRK